MLHKYFGLLAYNNWNPLGYNLDDYHTIITIVKPIILLLFNILIFYKVIDKKTYSIQRKLDFIIKKKNMTDKYKYWGWPFQWILFGFNIKASFIINKKI